MLLEEHERVRLLERDYNNNLLRISHYAEENERKRIAQDLHDDIGALLSTTKLYLSHIKENTTMMLHNKIEVLLDKAIQNLRHISHRLSPTSLEQFGLISAIEGTIDDISKISPIQIDLGSNLTERLTVTQELHLYRIFQELLNNTLKYSKATKVLIRIERKYDVIMCEYTDNGVGFEMSPTGKPDSSGKGIDCRI